MKLLNLKTAIKEVKEFNESFKYIEFENKYDWIMHLGSLKGLTFEQIIDIYIRKGNNLEEVKKKLQVKEPEIENKIRDKFLEKEVEEYYLSNLNQIDPNLEIIKNPYYGRQYPTHIGYIDLLCMHKKTKEYYVIEFKRNQVSDDTIGQILRYIGWVLMNLSESNKKVNGIIVGSEFPDKTVYALIGMQSNEDFIKFFTHPFNDLNKPKV